MHPRTLRTLLVALAIALTALAHARFEWRDVVQTVTIDKDGSVLVIDERTLWTDEDFGEAFICIGHPSRVRVTLLDGSGAVSPGPPATAFQQACESGAASTEVVVRQEQRVRERRVRFVYRLDGTVDVYRDVVQWYWNLIQLDHPPIVGYQLTVAAPGPMAAPYDAFVHRYANPEAPRVELSDNRRVLTVAFDSIPPGDGVEIRYLMDPALFTARGAEDTLARLLADETRIANVPATPTLGMSTASETAATVANEFDGVLVACPAEVPITPETPLWGAVCYRVDAGIDQHRRQLDAFVRSAGPLDWTYPWQEMSPGRYGRYLRIARSRGADVTVVVVLDASTAASTVVYFVPTP